MAKVVEFPRSPHNTDEPDDSANGLRLAYLRHIDEVFDDYSQNRASLPELAEHVKSIVSRLIGTPGASDLG